MQMSILSSRNTVQKSAPNLDLQTLEENQAGGGAGAALWAWQPEAGPSRCLAHKATPNLPCRKQGSFHDYLSD